jgi:putative nucleotidyltransferase with HDIG domain
VNPATHELLSQRIRLLGNLPAMPSILSALSDELSIRASQINVDRVVTAISYDKSLTAQCLRLANSALFRQRGDVATVREAVFALGLWRIRDLAFSCSLPLMFTNVCKAVRREVFWRHSLGTALIAQTLEQRLCETHTNQAYLCGLLHDIGILVNGVLFPEEFRDVLEEAVSEKVRIPAIEQRILGFTHEESGKILAELWRLPIEVSEVVEYHHHRDSQPGRNDLTFLVSVADEVCLKYGLGYGYEIEVDPVLALRELWDSLRARFPKAADYSADDSQSVIESAVASAISLADHVFSAASTTAGETSQKG